MRVKIEVGQCWERLISGTCALTHKIFSVINTKVYSQKIVDFRLENTIYSMGSIDSDGYLDEYFYLHWFLIPDVKLRPPHKVKVFPDIPLDSSLPILMAGHLQDRQRKRFRQEKTK